MWQGQQRRVHEQSLQEGPSMQGLSTPRTICSLGGGQVTKKRWCSEASTPGAHLSSVESRQMPVERHAPTCLANTLTALSLASRWPSSCPHLGLARRVTTHQCFKSRGLEKRTAPYTYRHRDTSSSFTQFSRAETEQNTSYWSNTIEGYAGYRNEHERDRCSY